MLLLAGLSRRRPSSQAGEAGKSSSRAGGAAQPDHAAGIRAVAATVRPDESLVDGRPCVVFDYSRTSLVARGVRDEVRLVAPGLYLGVAWLFGNRVGWFAVRERRPGTGTPPSPAGESFARLAVAVDDRRRWDRFPTWSRSP